MKKYISLFAAAAIMAGSLSLDTFAGTQDSDSIQIVTTIFPEYDWVMNILGENPAGAQVTMLLDNGVDLHSYQPAAEDILKISTCDLFIYVGGESDGWVDDALQEATNEDMVVIDLLDVLGDSVKEEEMVEGMEEHEHDHEEGEEHDHEDGEEHDHEEGEEHDHEEGEAHDHEEGEEHDHDHGEGEVEYDEHVWLSLRNVSVLTERICESLKAIDPDNAESYDENASSYIEALKELDSGYEKAVEEASVKVLLFGDRFPFRYLVDDYGLDYYAAFAGCSAETEASFETVRFLAQKVEELSLHSVMTIEGSDHRIAETIIQSTKSKDQQILSLDSMQSTTSKDVEAGTTYLAVMEKNLSVLKEALK